VDDSFRSTKDKIKKKISFENIAPVNESFRSIKDEKQKKKLSFENIKP
jgi:hypothetical protein